MINAVTINEPKTMPIIEPPSRPPEVPSFPAGAGMSNLGRVGIPVTFPSFEFSVVTSTFPEVVALVSYVTVTVAFWGFGCSVGADLFTSREALVVTWVGAGEVVASSVTFELSGVVLFVGVAAAVALSFVMLTRGI
jgi:hypothetical protein